MNKGRDDLQTEKKPCAVGVAIEMIEAWLLADESALRTALGDPTIPRQPDPESLDAGDEANDHHPKGRLERLMVASLCRDVERSEYPVHYAAIVKAANVPVLAQRCLQGFAPFADQVRELTSA